MLWLAAPFAVVPADDPIMQRTVARIIEELSGPSGGVRRYRRGTFYGGGEWVLLTVSLVSIWRRSVTWAARVND